MIAALAGVVALATPGLAAAKAVIRAGVPIDSLTPTGLTRGEVMAPSAEGLPVRIVYTGDNGKPAVAIDVVVAADAAGARAALATAQRGVSRTDSSAERSDIGDAAFGRGRIVGFVKDNVAIVVLRLEGSIEVEDLAKQALAAVEAAPAAKQGEATIMVGRTSPVVSLDKRANGGAHEIARMSVQGDVVASRASATGAGYIRARGQASWSLIRTGKGAIDVSVVAVDSLLRVSTYTPTTL